MYSAGRQGTTEHLDLAAAGLEADNRGRLSVDEHYRTPVEHIYAVGDVIGFPALAATSMDQGRLAAYHAFGEPVHELTALQPIGIYTIPEISNCGATEASATRTACSSCWCPLWTARSSACTCSAPAPRTSCTSARP
jgi:NAD(P) transhydrogenase